MTLLSTPFEIVGPEKNKLFVEMARLSRDRMIWLLAHPPLTPSVSSTSDTGRLRNRDNLFTGEGGRGQARSRIIRLQESLGLCKSVSSLWVGQHQAESGLYRPAARLLFTQSKPVPLSHMHNVAQLRSNPPPLLQCYCTVFPNKENRPGKAYFSGFFLHP
jgi:hypothetical protein